MGLTDVDKNVDTAVRMPFDRLPTKVHLPGALLTGKPPEDLCWFATNSAVV